MKPLPHLLAAAILAALSAPAFAETSFDVIGGSEISFEGLIQSDYNKYNDDVARLSASAADGRDSDSDLRRAELVFKGKGPGQWNWVLGYDAKANKFLDANVAYKFDGYTTLTVGQSKQPNSLEELSSTKNNDFISKALVTNLYSVARRTGVSLGTGGESWTLTGSVFGRELTRNLANGNGYGARFTWRPIGEESNFLHLGLSAVDFAAKDATGDDRARLRARPGADLAGTRLIDSGQFTDADRLRTLGFEAAWVHGPFKLQSEYMTNTVSRNLHSDFSGNSWYVSGLWNLTGETWGYKNGVITTGLPNEPASGMWQLGVRYDRADLNDGLVRGGTERNLTVGVNWYWRSNFKFALNYVDVQSKRGVIQDDPSIVELRAQIYW